MTAQSLSQSKIKDIFNSRTGCRGLSVVDRFYKNCMPVPESGCWIWIGSVDRHGYGRQRVNGKLTGAHRLSAAIHKNENIDGLCVCHHCDTPLCVNPEHLFIGTNNDNVQDMIKKGRDANHKGVGNPRSKLTEVDVAAIKQDVRLNTEIAKSYGISNSTVSNIKTGKIWKHII